MRLGFLFKRYIVNFGNLLEEDIWKRLVVVGFFKDLALLIYDFKGVLLYRGDVVGSFFFDKF